MTHEEALLNSKYKSLFSDTVLFVVSNFGSKFLVFLLMPLYTHILSNEEYGTADLLTTTVSLLLPILTLSICDATLKFALNKAVDSKKVLINSLFLVLCAMVVVLCFCPVAYMIKRGVERFFWYFFFLFFFTALNTVFSSFLKGCGKTKIYAIQGILYTLVLILCNILFLLFLKIGLYGYLISIIIASAFSCLFMFFVGKIYAELSSLKLDFSLMRQMIGYSAPMMLASVAWWINSSSDKYMLIGLVGIAANGLYAAAHKIPTIFSTMTSVFSQAWRISAISSSEESDKEVYYSNTFRFYSCVCVYACIGVTILTPLLASFLFSNSFFVAWRLVPPLLLAAVFEALAGFLASIYAAMSRTKMLMISTCVGAAVNIALNYILIVSLGEIGAPIATFISFLVVFGVRIVLLNKWMRFRVNYYRLVPSLVLLILGNILFACNVHLKYLWYIVFALIILVVNIKDTKIMFGFLVRLLNSKRGIKND